MNEPSLLPVALLAHRQLHPYSCAVSGFECIAKLHGWIKPDAFPLQLDLSNQAKGFDDTKFLESFGVICSSPLLSASDAFNEITRMTAAGKYPLVVLFDKAVGYHAYVVAPGAIGPMLIDPAGPRIIESDPAKLKNLLISNSKANPQRSQIHVLTYQ